MLSSRGELMMLEQVSKKAGISVRVVETIVSASNVQSYKISGRRFVYYREFLRGAWDYELSKKSSGRNRKDSDG